MSQAVARFVEALDRLGRGVTAFELLDALLIAPRLGLNTATPKARPQEPERPPPTPSAESDPPPVAEPPPADSPPDVPIESAGAKQGGERPAAAVRLPAGGPPLRGRQFARALRGFRHRVPSRVRWELDEDGTVQLRAETRLPLVRLRAVRERAVTLCLVVDRTASMEVWADTVRALVRTAMGAGVFRAVRLLKVDTEGPSPAVGRWHGTLHTDGVRPPSGVGTVVLVVSDLCSKAWWNGSAFRLFAKWNRLVPVGLVGLMPETLWQRTALGERRLLPLVRPAPAGPIHMLSLPGYEAGDVLPLGTLDPKAMSALAGMLGHNHATVRGIGVWVPVDEEAGEEAPPANVEDPAVIVRQFLATASPQAVRLAGLLALFNSPTARTLRLVRGAAGLNTEPSHEAEVLLGGLMRGERRTVKGRPAWEYKFHDGVQAELVSRATWGDAEPRQFFDRFHTYLERRKNELNGIRAAIPTTGDATIRGLEDQFLSLNATTLAALGPRAADLGKVLAEVRQAEAAALSHYEQYLSEMNAAATRRTTVTEPSALQGHASRTIEPTLGETRSGKKTRSSKLRGAPAVRQLTDDDLYFARRNELELLRTGQSTVASRQVIVGPRGAGKSSLLALYFYRHRDDYSRVLNASAEKPEDFRVALVLSWEGAPHPHYFSQLLGRIELIDLPGLGAGSGAAGSVREVIHFLRANYGWLLMIDHADTPEAVREVEAVVRELPHGHVIVASSDADTWERHWQRIPLAAIRIRPLSDYTPGTVVSAKVVTSEAGGIRVEFEGRTAFIPWNEWATNPAKHADLVGRTVECEVVRVKEEGEVVLSRRKLLQRRFEEQRDQFIKRISVGQLLKGVVKPAENRGVWVDVGDGKAWLSASNFSWLPLKNPRGYFSPNQEIEVRVVRVDVDARSVEVSLKHMTPDPWEKEIPSKYPPGTVVRAVVESVTEHGILVTLPDGMRVSIAISELSEKRIRHPDEVVKVGDEVRVKVLQIDVKERKLSLTMRGVGRTPQAFVCYAAEDRPFVERLVEWLRHNGWQGYDGPLYGGRPWGSQVDAIREGIDPSDAVVVILSPDWLNSRFCRQEFFAAIERNKRIEYIVHRDFDPDRLKGYADSIDRQWIDFTRDEAAGFRQLADRLRQFKIG